MTSVESFICAKKILEQSGIAEPEAKAKIIVSHVLGIGLGDVYGDYDVPKKEQAVIDDMTERCAHGTPVQYVTGKAYFRHAVLDVTGDVLIPRSETELVAGAAIDIIHKNGYQKAIDVCTGSGCIAVSLAMETDADVYACDISEKAIKIAKRNALINSAADKAHFFISDMFESITDTFDIIVCNPPYVSESEYLALGNSVREFEPKIALLAGDGLDFYRTISNDSLRCLNRGGALVLEIGATQAENVRRMLGQGGYKGIEYSKDYSGRDRVVCAYRR